jgi:hypothetical protein
MPPPPPPPAFPPPPPPYFAPPPPFSFQQQGAPWQASKSKSSGIAFAVCGAIAVLLGIVKLQRYDGEQDIALYVLLAGTGSLIWGLTRLYHKG